VVHENTLLELNRLLNVINFDRMVSATAYG
jgi:hypothetical protein